MLKTDVKTLAREHGLPTADREESMGLCFVGERKAPSPLPPRALGLPSSGLASAGFSAFLQSYLPQETSGSSDIGPIYNLETGAQVGLHHGLHTLTIGQNARIPGAKARLFVAKKVKSAADAQGRDVVYVVEGRTHPALQCEHLVVRPGDFHWIGELPRELQHADGSLRALAQIRHRQPQVRCTVRLLPQEQHLPVQQISDLAPTSPRAAVEVTFDEPVDAASEGQVVALWTDDGITLGSGVIDSVQSTWDQQQGNLSPSRFDTANSEPSASLMGK